MSVDEFARTRSRIEQSVEEGRDIGDRDEMKRILCADCDFYTPGEDEDLLCGCFKILSRLLTGGEITLSQLENVLRK